MNKDQAASKADDIIKIIIANQEAALGLQALRSVESAKIAAQAVASFRKELIAQLEQQ